jgi:glutathione peroxidase
MNELLEKYPDNLVILAFPSNQFGHQENSSGVEILNALQYVRPGNGYVPKAIMFDKVEVNGENEHPLFTFLKKEMPTPSDDKEALMGDPKFIIWKPVKRSDISWNFEKFLISASGEPVKRYSRHFLTANIADDIKGLV